MTRADAHMHLFPEGYRRPGHGSLFGARECDAYDTLRARHGIARALAIGYEADGIDPQNNAYLRRLAGQHDWLASLAYVDAVGFPETAMIAALLRDGHSGIAIYAPGEAQAQSLLRWPRAVWDLLASRRALVSFNARPESIAVLASLVRDAPAVPFLFSHLGLPGSIGADTPDSILRTRLSPLLGLATSANAHVKISGLYATSDPAHDYPHRGGQAAVDLLLGAFGPSRCLWASDFAPALDFVSFPQTIQIAALEALPTSDRVLVEGDNLLRLLDAVRVGL
jgi:predicted TIM-barrel fold metal-dependent hydrolase